MTTGLAHGLLQKPICLGVQVVSGDQQKEDHRQQFVLAQSVADLFRLYQGAQADEQAAGKECTIKIDTECSNNIRGKKGYRNSL